MFEELPGYVAEVGDLEVGAEIDQEGDVVYLGGVSWWSERRRRSEEVLVLFRPVQ